MVTSKVLVDIFFQPSLVVYIVSVYVRLCSSRNIEEETTHQLPPNGSQGMQYPGNMGYGVADSGDVPALTCYCGGGEATL